MVQERRSLLIDLLKKYFAEKGYHEVAPLEGLDLVFVRSQSTVGIKILFYSSNPLKDQKAIRSYIYRLLRERPCDEIYFAIDEIRYSHLPRFEEFKESGIGLLKVLENGVEIAILAKPFDNIGLPLTREQLLTRRNDGSAVNAPLPEDILIKELERRMVEILEQRVAEHLLKRIRETDKKTQVLRGPLETSFENFDQSKSDNRRSYAVPDSEVFLDVEFLKGNPWLGELMKRGKE